MDHPRQNSSDVVSLELNPNWKSYTSPTDEIHAPDTPRAHIHPYKESFLLGSPVNDKKSNNNSNDNFNNNDNKDKSNITTSTSSPLRNRPINVAVPERNAKRQQDIMNNREITTPKLLSNKNNNNTTILLVPPPPPPLHTVQRNRSISLRKQDNNDLQEQFRTKQKKPTKYCKLCGDKLTGQFVRALGEIYHVKCFCCYECGKECASKFFSSETIDPTTGKEIKIALCEQDYFKKLDLVCYTCQNALRGPYVTLLNRKYHLEHFTCSVCSRIFAKDESFYEHDDGIYCHYHYSKQYAAHCEGCHSPILKQYAEIFRGGRIQQWHPECFMVHKFWSLTITADFAGFPFPPSMFVLPDGSFRNLGDLDLSREELFKVEHKLEQIIMSVWLTFSTFEEATAACISNMLQFASTGQQFKGLITTGKLILMVEKLFNGINALHSLGVENLEMPDPKYQNLRKEPRSLSAKIMTYLAILRKSSNKKIGDHSKELLSLITGLAHYLKLIIRYGLYHALQYNKFSHSNLALERFSKEVRAHESIPDDVFPILNVPPNSTDSCPICKKSIEQECVLFGTKRWHLGCLKCAKCERSFTQSTVLDASYDQQQDLIYCSHCSMDIHDLERGFVNISSLSQLIYLLKIALVRSKVIMHRDMKLNDEGPDKIKDSKNNENELRYKQTLTDIKRMRSTRRDQKIFDSLKQKARRSRIIETPDADFAESEMFLDEDGVNLPEKLTFLHSNFENGSEPSSSHHQRHGNRNKKLIVEDEPQSKNDAMFFDRTTDLLKNQKSLTLDDIPRIVSAEQAREQRPNAFKHLTNSNTSIDPKPRSMKLASRSNTTGKLLAASSNALAKASSATSTTTNATPLPTIANSKSNNNNLNLNSTPHNNSSMATKAVVTTNSQTASRTGSQNKGNSDVDAAVIAQSFKEKKQIYYSELNEPQHFILRHIAILALIKTNNKYTREELLTLIPTRKNPTFWGKIFKSSDSVTTRKTSQSMASIFGAPLEDLTMRYGVESDLGVGPMKLKIPLLVDECISAMHQMDMSVEGVFRKNGNIKGLRMLTEAINTNPTRLPDFTKETPIQLAALLKKFLRELPDPLLTFKLYDLWISSQNYNDNDVKCRILKICNCMLPTSHRDFTEVLLYFLRWVTSFSYIDKDTGSKMHTHNLATVITPNILYSKPLQQNGKQDSSSPTDQIPGGEQYLLAIEVLDMLLQTPEEFAMVPSFLTDFYEKAGFGKDDELTTKEILARCDVFMKLNPNFFEENFDSDLMMIMTDDEDFGDDENDVFLNNNNSKGVGNATKSSGMVLSSTVSVENNNEISNDTNVEKNGKINNSGNLDNEFYFETGLDSKRGNHNNNNNNNSSNEEIQKITGQTRR